MASDLRQMLSESRMVVAPGVHDGLAAKVFGDAGFPAVYMSGNGTSASLLGAPDIGLLTMTEMVMRARAIVAATGVPVIADADTGYGNAVNVARTVREYEAAGVCAIHLEDQVMPKKCGAMAGLELVSADEHADRIRAAIDARSSADFLIIGRTDARLPLGFEEALRRARTYADAGADLVLVEMLQSPQEIEHLVRQMPVPVMMNAVSGKTPDLVPAEFANLGIAILAYPLASILTYTRSMRDLAAHLAHGGSPAQFSPAELSLDQYAQVLGSRA
ncbi:oxaloacetate decarboxylase [Nocardia sp. NPDC088792]|uniref:isocitrate lyase/PEP mutase family protein n=1 Tax=Nocardia sp. NPDC088792 TaxID=3364332 RepID=UPI00381CB0B0